MRIDISASLGSHCCQSRSRALDSRETLGEGGPPTARTGRVHVTWVFVFAMLYWFTISFTEEYAYASLLATHPAEEFDSRTPKRLWLAKKQQKLFLLLLMPAD